MLVDADNLPAVGLRILLRALPTDEAAVVAAGSPRALASVAWPAGTSVRTIEGWQQADLLLARAYRPGREPLVVASGDGDFAGIVHGHAGPVLVVADRPAAALRGAGTVLDPLVDGAGALRDWFDAVIDVPWQD